MFQPYFDLNTLYLYIVIGLCLVYLGEMTFFPAAGMGKFEPEDWDEKLGEWIKLR